MMKKTSFLLLSSLLLSACATTSPSANQLRWPKDASSEVSDAILAWSQGNLILPTTEAEASSTSNVQSVDPKIALLMAESLVLQYKIPEAVAQYIDFLKTTQDHSLTTVALIRLRNLLHNTNAAVPYNDILSLRTSSAYNKALLCLLQDEALGARIRHLKPSASHPTALALTQIGWVGPFSTNAFSEYDQTFPADNDAILADEYIYDHRKLEKFRYVSTHQTVFSAQLNGIYIGETYINVDKDMDVLLTFQSPHLYSVQLDGEEITPAYTHAFQWNPLSVIRVRLSSGHHTLRIRLSKLPKSSDLMPFKAWIIPDTETRPSSSTIHSEHSLSALHETTSPGQNASSQKLEDIDSPHLKMDIDSTATNALHAWAYNVMAIHNQDMSHANEMIKKRQSLAPNDVQNILSYADMALADFNRSSHQRSDSAMTSLESVSESAPDYALVHLRLANLFLEKNMTQTAFDTIQDHLDVMPDNADMSMYMSSLYKAMNWEDDARDAIVHAYHLEPEWCSIATSYLKAMSPRHAVPAYQELSDEIQHCIPIIQFYRDLGYGNKDRLSQIEQLSPNIDTWKLPRLLDQVTQEPDMTFDALLTITDTMSRRQQSSIAASSFFPFIDAYRAMGRDELAHALLERLLSIQPEDVSLHYLKWFINYKKPLSEMRHDGIARIQSYMANAPVSDASSIIVFDYAGNYYFENGASMLLTHTITRVLDKDGKTESGEIVVPQNAAILNLRTIKQNTYEIVEPEIIDHKQSISAPNLAVGDFIEVEYVTWKKPQDPSNPSVVLDPRFYFGMLMTPLVHSEYTVEYPASWNMQYVLRGNRATDITPTCQTKDDRTRCVTSIENISPYITEPNSLQLDDLIPNIQYYSNYSWDKARLRLANTMYSKMTATPYVQDYLASLHVPSGTIRDRALFIYEHVMSDIKEDDSDNYFATSATHTVMRKSGSRMPLLKALYDLADIPSSIALLRHIASIRDLSIPTENFMDNYVPALVVETESGPAYVQTLEDVIPFDYLPPEVQGQDVVMLDEDRATITSRRDPFEALAGTIDIQYQVSLDGNANITSTETLLSDRALTMRYILSRVQDDREQINRIIENSLSRNYGRIKLHDFQYENLKSYTSPLKIHYTFDAANFATSEDHSLRIHTSFLTYRLAARYAPLGQRNTPLVISDANVTKRILTFSVPEGYTFEKPETEHLILNESFGRFERHYTWSGHTLTIEEITDIRPMIVSPENYDQFRAFCLKVDSIQNGDFIAHKATP